MCFEIDENGRILVCAETPVKMGMVWLPVPDNFKPDEMHNWIVVDNTLTYSPQAVEETLSQEERMEQIEYALIETAAIQAEQEQRQNEVEAALIELASLLTGGVL